MSMPPCVDLLRQGGTAVSIVASPVFGVIVSVPISLIAINYYFCGLEGCYIQPTVQPAPAPAPPRPVPGGTPIPETRTGTGENPLALPAVYQAPQPGVTPTPGGHPFPIPVPTPDPGPTCTPTPEPDPDKVRLYHGTKSPPWSFFVIDVSRGDGQWGPGFYTTPDRDAAEKIITMWQSHNPGSPGILWADVPKQWILEARRLTDSEDRRLSLRGDWGPYSRVAVPPDLEYLMTDYDIIYGPLSIGGLHSIQYKFNPTLSATVKVNLVKWHYEPLEEE